MYHDCGVLFKFYSLFGGLKRLISETRRPILKDKMIFYYRKLYSLNGSLKRLISGTRRLILKNKWRFIIIKIYSLNAA